MKLDARMQPRRMVLCFALVGLVCAAAGAGQLSNGRKIVKKVEAQYPTILKRKGIGGTVRLKVVVKADGSVKSTEVLGGNPILADSAQTAVMQWKFSSGVSDTIVDIAVEFDPRS
jgi:TonB family protein